MRRLIAPILVSLALAVAGVPARGQQTRADSSPAAGDKNRHSNESEAVLLRQAEDMREKADLLRRELNEKDILLSIHLLRQSGQVYVSAGRPTLAARAYIEAGNRLVMVSRFEAAIVAHRLALELARTDVDLRCTALSGLARTYADIGPVNIARRYSGWAEKVCVGASDRRVQADAMESRGEVMFWANDYKEATASLDRARQLFAELKDQDGQASALLMLAYAANSQNPQIAREYAENALELWLSTGDAYGVARVRLALGYFASNTGELSVAQCHCDEALPVFHQMGDKDNQAIALNILGKVSQEAGDFQTSLDDYQKARTAFASVHDQPGEIEAITGITSALSLMHKNARVLALYEYQFKLAQHAKMPALMAAVLSNMASIYESKHLYSKSESLFQQALIQYRTLGHIYGASDMLVRLATLKAETGQHADAISFLEQARRLKETTSEAGQIARIQYELAYAYRRLGRQEEAKTEIEKTVRIIESERLQISSFDSRASYFASVHQYYSLYIQILMLLESQHPEQGYKQRAFEASEKSKARSLLDLLARAPEDRPCAALMSKKLNAARSLPAAEKYETEETSAQPTLRLQQLQQELGENDSVLEYALGDEKSHLWIVDRKQISGFDLPPAENIKKLVEAFRRSLTPPEPDKDESSVQYITRKKASTRAHDLAARLLSKAILGPAELAAGRRLLIVPDGYLQYVPFSALPLPRSKDENVLLTQHEIVVLPSASALSILRAAASKRAPPRSGVIVFADPVFETTTAEGGMESASLHRGQGSNPAALSRALFDAQRSQHIPSLPGSRREALAIREVFGTEDVFVAVGLDATRDLAISGRLEPYRVVHFATHGIIDTRHPDMSGLVLTLVNGQGERQDGYLRLGDIYKLKLSADLIVLSSCDSALGKQLESEGIIGLPRGFLHAGARSVIASLWKVDDEATATLMRGLYEHLRRGDSPSTALRAAQLEVLENKRYSQPYYWAAFVLEGDYN